MNNNTLKERTLSRIMELSKRHNIGARKLHNKTGLGLATCFDTLHQNTTPSLDTCDKMLSYLESLENQGKP